MKNCRIWTVYIADMYDLQHQTPDVWAALMRKEFSYQDYDIPGTATGGSHVGEQENKKIKSHGGITGITRNENNRTRHLKKWWWKWWKKNNDN